ncbi:sulfhydryl oxidase 1 [Python bivittatus]|uniref:Sulfhydryl oxidase n=1 Tax=Python bivittatus TaxID=176946 RepID=A0A9F2WFE3_PYTBI|nr:sulfhydryl oxidase 1 [Python bivittatus]
MPRRLSGAGPRHLMPPACIARVAAFLLLVPVPGARSLGLYSPDDPLVLLAADTLERHIFNSTSAWVVEFYASWCGHCKAFAPTWKALANDVKDWRPAVMLGVIDCADFSNKNICYKFGINSYPTLKFFKTFSKNPEDGIQFSNHEKTVQALRETIITSVERQEDVRPSASPPLRPASMGELRDFFLRNNVTYLAVIFEKDDSFLSREVALDMLQFENIAVRRVLQSNEELVRQFNITTFPSGLLVINNGSCSSIPGHADWRSQYTKFLRNLPGVFRGNVFIPTVLPTAQPTTALALWKVVDKRKLYMADLESAVLFTLRIEAAVFPYLRGQRLSALKDYVSVLVEHFAGRSVVKNYLRNLDLWLRPKKKVLQSEWEEALRNKKEFPNATLSERPFWVGCQGSTPNFRGFPCGLWTLFHHLTVQAACQNQSVSASSDTPEVLPTMRRYVRYFFGCRMCAEHFENMAAESMHEVRTRNQAVLWLWSRHNRVNARLAGTPSDDPKFPKIQWPPKDLCPSCRYTQTEGSLRNEEKPTWDKDAVLLFLKRHFSEKNIFMEYFMEHRTRNGRNVAQQNYEAEWKLEAERRGEENGQGSQKELEEDKKTEQPEIGKVEEKKYALGKPGSPEPHKPSIVKMSTKAKEMVEDIVDLDTFSEQHFKSKALKMARQISIRQRRSKRDTGLFLMENEGRHSLDYIRESLRHKNLGVQFSGIQVEDVKKKNSLRENQWIHILGMGFSRLDVSLCILLYLLSSVCLLGMYTFFRMRMSYRKGRSGYPLT